MPVKLITGFIFKEDAAFIEAKSFLEKRFGRTDSESQTIPFSYTSYYEKEFGKDLKRKFLSFEKLIAPEDLASIKTLTNKLEIKLSRDKRRMINIDPGYLDLAKLILATTKDFSHRVYLGRGIFSELTLMFREKTFSPLEWTYPDYRSQEYINIFNKIRESYAKGLNLKRL